MSAFVLSESDSPAYGDFALSADASGDNSDVDFDSGFAFDGVSLNERPFPNGILEYSCKYTPLEIMAVYGCQPKLLDCEARDFSRAEALTHANFCSHAKALLESADPQNGMVIMDCCDSLRRIYDVLYAGGDYEFLEILELPHEGNRCALERFADEIKRFAKALEAMFGADFDRHAFLSAWRESARHGAPAQTEPFFAVVGARVSPPLFGLIESTLDFPVLNLTCSGDRLLSKPPDAAESLEFDELMKVYAKALMTMMPCVRMADVSERRSLIEHPQLMGIVYNTVKFCDFYGFDYRELQERTTIPLLKIESDYMPTPVGQISTRLEAFRESVVARRKAAMLKAPMLQDECAIQNECFMRGECAMKGEDVTGKEGASRGESATKGLVMELRENRRLFAGIDSGSTTTNMVVVDERGTMVASAIVRTGAKAQNGARAALEEVCHRLNVTVDDFAAIMATGYGRANISFATDSVTEITCHAIGAHYVNPAIRTIVDIGGQDSKVICLSEEGNVSNFVMNDKCAAGTGRFLEAMARTLEMDIATLARKGLSWNKELTISSMCTVFAESEVISLIADNHHEADIIHGLNSSIASRTASMVKRAKGKGPYMMTGGVARNQGVVHALEDRLDTTIYVADEPDLCGALGAALLARQHCLHANT